MSKNYMKEVANSLGLKLNKEFRVKDKDSKDYVYMFNRNHLMCRIHDYDAWFKSNMLSELLNGSFKIDKSILSEEEKKYLNDIFKLFREQIETIQKESYDIEGYYQRFVIRLKNNRIIFLRPFKKRVAFAGMTLDKEYTLKELGL